MMMDDDNRGVEGVDCNVLKLKVLLVHGFCFNKREFLVGC